MSATLKAVLFDVDGTLVDSNEAHAAAWVQAFREFGVTVDPIEVRRSIGMGGDKLMPLVSGIEEESPQGTAIVERRSEIFAADYLPKLEAFRDSDRLVAKVKDLGLNAVAASSAQKDELTKLLKIAGVDRLMDAKTSSDDADQSKPAPDIIHAALKQAGVQPSEAVMIGDTPYDVASARRAGVRVVAFRCGGWIDPDLVGAIEIYDGPWDLLARIERSVLTS
jgi:beta-phosphoglucomutase-like phosphatase (HAD superfamily)